MNAKRITFSILVAIPLVSPQAGTGQNDSNATRAVTIEDVGDAASFGRNVTYLGFAQSIPVDLAQDCTGATPETRCVTLAPAPESTSFEESQLAQITLPARATRSLVCFAVTPVMTFEFLNTTGAPQPFAEFGVRGTVTVENEILDDPALIDPSTGLPFGGQIVLGLPTYREARSLAVDELAFKRLSVSRACIAGLLSKRGLMENFGFSEALATQFFRKPITFRFGAAGIAQLVSSANYLYGIRLYGD